MVVCIAVVVVDIVEHAVVCACLSVAVLALSFVVVVVHCLADNAVPSVTERADSCNTVRLRYSHSIALCDQKSLVAVLCLDCDKDWHCAVESMAMGPCQY